MVAAKRLDLRRPDSCASCGAELAAGVTAWWDRDTRRVTCLACMEHAAAGPKPDPPQQVPDATRPGAIPSREYERRRANRERRIREAHPRIGGLLLAWTREPQHQKAFKRGAQGELTVAAAIEKAVARVDGIVLHSRDMPGGHGDIDHIAIVPNGIYVIDSKAVTGKVEVRTRRSHSPVLYVGRWDKTTYLDGLDRQVQAVRAALDAAGAQAVPIQAALCFAKADLPSLRTVEMRGHLLLYRKALAKRLVASGALQTDQLSTLAVALREGLPPA